LLNFLLYFAVVLSFDEEVSKTISLEQCKSVICNDAVKTRCKDGGQEKDADKTETPVAKVSAPYFSISPPRQSKTSGTTPRSARSSAAHSVRGTYVKSKSSHSKHRHQQSQSPSSEFSAGDTVGSVTKKLVDSECDSPKTLSKSDALTANLCGRRAVDNAASFSQLFPGSCVINLMSCLPHLQHISMMLLAITVIFNG